MPTLHDSARIITIDGLTGSGKTAIAKQLAHNLGWRHVDLDSILRKLSQACFAREANPNDIEVVAPIISQYLSDIEAFINNSHELGEFLSHTWDTALRRGAYILTDHTSPIPQSIGNWINQYITLSNEGIVLDGYGAASYAYKRHTSTHIFLVAQPHIRAQRRLLGRDNTAEQIDFATMLASIKIEEEGREEKIMAPNGLPDGVFRIDTDLLSIDGTARMIERIHEHRLTMSMYGSNI